MSKFNDEFDKFADNYIEKIKGINDEFLLTEEIDAAYARANSIERNRDMKNKNNIARKKSWIKIAKEIQKMRDSGYRS